MNGFEESSLAPALFKKMGNIVNRLTEIDPHRRREEFEEEYEAKLNDLYMNLLEVDELISKRFCGDKEIGRHFSRFLKASREFDALWDRYHAEGLDLKQYSLLISTHRRNLTPCTA